MRVFFGLTVLFALLLPALGINRVVFNSAFNPRSNRTYGPTDRPRCYLEYICPLLFYCHGGYCLYNHEAARRQEERERNKPGFFRKMFETYWPFG